MKPLLHLIELREIPILQQLKWEEALLRTDTNNWCLINQGSPPAIVMGISGQMERLICSESLRRAPIPIIRRFSGGGTVVVDENTMFVTLICQSTALPVQPFPRPLMEWNADLYRPIFPGHSFQLCENDYTFGEKKWGGNAQSIVRGRWLHHSSLLWDFHPEKMNYLLLPPKMPVYRQDREHADFLCRLKDYGLDNCQFKEAFIQQLGCHFTVLPGDLQKLEELAALPHRKATTCIQ